MPGRRRWLLRVVLFCVAFLSGGAWWLDEHGRNIRAAGPPVPLAQDSAPRFAVDAPEIGLAPYVWKRSGVGATARAEATMPGAYLKTACQGTASVRLLIDGTANDGCPAGALPVVDYSVDDGPFQSVSLTKTGEVYPLTLAEGLDPNTPHRLEVHFRAAGLGPARWQASTVHLRIAGIELEPGGSLLDYPRRRKLAIGFGDSITEGVCNEGLCPYYSNLLMNNARATWFPLVCAALGCEYGQLGTGGQGMVRPIEIPPLPQTWDHFDATTSRLTDGRLLPEPDYVFCAMGTNDFRTTAGNREQLDITDAYTGWLAAVRKACPRSVCFCIVPPLGWHASEITAAVAARNQAGDRGVYLIDTAPLKAAFHESQGTHLAPDGVHPSVYGNAMLATLIAVEAQKILSSTQPAEVRQLGSEQTPGNAHTPGSEPPPDRERGPSAPVMEAGYALPPEEPVFRFVQMNDLHVQAAEPAAVSVEQQTYKHANEKARWVVEAINSGLLPHVDFAVGVGDLIHGEGLDRLGPDFAVLQRLLQPLRCPFYPVVGNHEVVQQERSATHLQPYRAAFGEDRGDYTFTAGGILFVALNNSGAPSAEASKQRNEWLRDVLSAGRGQPKIILCHIPLIPLRDEPTLAKSFGFSSYCDRDPGTLNLVEEHRDTVIAVLSGHLHLTGVKHKREIWHISIAGTASYPSDIALYEVFPDRIEVTVKQLPEDLAKSETSIHGTPRHSRDFTDTEHRSAEDYQAGRADERCFAIPLAGGKRPPVKR